MINDNYYSMYRNKGYCVVTCPSLNKRARALRGSKKNPFISKRTALSNQMF